MTKEDCLHQETWNYLGWEDVKYTPVDDGDHFDQTKWVTTIISKIHSISVLIHKSSYLGGVNTITINRKLISLIELISYNYYNPDNQTLCGRYQIVFDDNISDDIMFLSHIPKTPLVALPIFNKATKENCFDSVEFKPIGIFSEEEIDTYVRGLKGCIEIQNYV